MEGGTRLTYAEQLAQDLGFDPADLDGPQDEPTDQQGGYAGAETSTDDDELLGAILAGGFEEEKEDEEANERPATFRRHPKRDAPLVRTALKVLLDGTTSQAVGLDEPEAPGGAGADGEVAARGIPADQSISWAADGAPSAQDQMTSVSGFQETLSFVLNSPEQAALALLSAGRLVRLAGERIAAAEAAQAAAEAQARESRRQADLQVSTARAHLLRVAEAAEAAEAAGHWPGAAVHDADLAEEDFSMAQDAGNAESAVPPASQGVPAAAAGAVGAASVDAPSSQAPAAAANVASAHSDRPIDVVDAATQTEAAVGVVGARSETVAEADPLSEMSTDHDGEGNSSGSGGVADANVDKGDERRPATATTAAEEGEAEAVASQPAAAVASAPGAAQDRSAVEAVRQQLAETEAARDELQALLSESEAAREGMQGQLDQLAALVDEAAAEIQMRATAQEQAEAGAAQLRDQLQDAESQLDTAKSRIDSLKSQLEAAEGRAAAAAAAAADAAAAAGTAISEEQEQARLAAALRPQVEATLRTELTDKVTAELRTELTDKVESDLKSQLEDRVRASMRADEAVRSSVADELKQDPAVRSSVADELKQDPAVRSSVADELKQDPAVRSSVADELKQDPAVRSEAHAALRTELEPTVRSELAEEARAAAKEDLRAEVTGAMREEIARAAVAEARPAIEKEAKKAAKARTLEKATQQFEKLKAVAKANIEKVREESQAELHQRDERLRESQRREEQLRARDMGQLAPVAGELQDRAAALRRAVAELRAGVAATMEEEVREAYQEFYAAVLPRARAAERGTERVMALLRRERAERRRLHNQVIELKGNIRVFARVRQLLPRELESGQEFCVEFPADEPQRLQLWNGRKKRHQSWEMDQVFGPAVDNERIFEEVAPIVTSVLDGYNACIFAYGQTGSGKTYTMEGPPENRGVNYRAIERLWAKIDHMRSEGALGQHIGVVITMLEVYCEEIRDMLAGHELGRPMEHVVELLDTDGAAGLAAIAGKPARRRAATNPKMEVKGRPGGGRYVGALTAVVVEDCQQTLSVMEEGYRRRTNAATKMNLDSSRSHAVVALEVRIGLRSGKEAAGKLNLVDLAGSERVARSGVKGQQMKEAQAINTSLSALGNVVEARANSRAHVPYRDSQLTKVLQDSLEGDSKTLMFVNVNPCASSAEESVSSLAFAERVRRVEMGKATKHSARRGGSPAPAKSKSGSISSLPRRAAGGGGARR